MTLNELKTLSRKKQSPVDLREDKARLVNVPPLVMVGHWLNDGEAYLINNGKTAIVQLGGDRIPSVIKSGPLRDEEYEFYDAHFHWGAADSIGSEHTVHDTWYSMEVHVTHWNRKYERFAESLKYEDGLCTLVYFLLVKDEDCGCKGFSKLESITENLKHVVNSHTKTKIPANCLAWMRTATNNKFYYVYEGSYNAGNYPECVTYIVFPNPILIRSDQVAEFRKLKDEKGRRIVDNRRKQSLIGARAVLKAVT